MEQELQESKKKVLEQEQSGTETIGCINEQKANVEQELITAKNTLAQIYKKEKLLRNKLKSTKHQELADIKLEKQQFELKYAESSKSATIYQWITYSLAAALIFAILCSIIGKGSN